MTRCERSVVKQWPITGRKQFETTAADRNTSEKRQSRQTEIRDVAARLNAPETNPSHIKRELARDLVTQYHDGKAALAAEEHFNKIHDQKDRPDKIDRIDIKSGGDGVSVVDAIAEAGLCESKSAARRMIKQGAVRVDGEKVPDIDHRLSPQKPAYTIKVGKRRFIEIVVK